MHDYNDQPCHQQDGRARGHDQVNSPLGVDKQFKSPRFRVFIVGQDEQLRVWDNWGEHFHLV